MTEAVAPAEENFAALLVERDDLGAREHVGGGHRLQRADKSADAFLQETEAQPAARQARGEFAARGQQASVGEAAYLLDVITLNDLAHLEYNGDQMMAREGVNVLIRHLQEWYFRGEGYEPTQRTA